MPAMRCTTMLLAFVAAGSLLGFSSSQRHPNLVQVAYQTLTGHPEEQAAQAEGLQFRQERNCTVPVLNEARSFEGGLTNGERVTIRLDTDTKTYRFQIEPAWHAGQPSRLHVGDMTLDEADCTYVLNTDEPTRLAVNKDGILFGIIDHGASTPVRIVAFSEVYRELADLAGSWRIVGGSGIPNTLQEARIRPDGTFSRCSLTHASPMQCIPNTGRIAKVSDVFQATDASGQGGTLIIGKVAGNAVPILLRPDNAGDGLQFMVRQADNPQAAWRQAPGGTRSGQQIHVIAPLFHSR